MKLATYNVWNHDIEVRFDQLIQEIHSISADIIGLQEVTASFYEILKEKTHYEHVLFVPYRGEDEGLAILSNYPFEETTAIDHVIGVNVVFSVEGLIYSLTNVHFPSEDIEEQERQVIAVDRFMNEHKEKVDYCILLGDFNSGLNASVHRFLDGEQTLNGQGPCTRWDEMFSAFAILHGLPVKATLDCVNNPRWKGKNTYYTPAVMDRIYIMDNWVKKTLVSAQLFGTTVSPKTKLAASDHYGVLVELDF